MSKKIQTIILLCLTLLFYTEQIFARQTAGELADKYIVCGGFQMGDGSLLQYRATELFTPASTLKILTALMALKTLGANFRFTTRLYLDTRNNLYIRGGGDPFLTSEAVLVICQQFQKKYPSIKKINAIFIDNSFYQLNGWQVSTEHSDNPYDAPNSALAVNFNALPVAVAANGNISSGEKQTPLLPIMQQKAKQLQLPSGKYRINIAYGAKDREAAILLYAAQLFAAQLTTCGIEVGKNIDAKKVPVGLPPALIYQSEKNLTEMVRLLLLHSNNFIANQIFLYLGARKSNTTLSTWITARQYTALFFKKTVPLPTSELTMVEGSGLSVDNTITCRAFITALNAFRPWAELLPKKNKILLKSGTMPHSGVFSYAGYFISKKTQKLTPYAILLNQKKNTRNELLNELAKKGSSF